MKHFSQTLKVSLALFVAVFANGTLTSITAYAAEPSGIEQTETVTESHTSPSSEDAPAVPQDTAPTSQPLVQPTEEQPVLKSALEQPTIAPCSTTTSEFVNTKAGFASYDDQRANGHYEFKSNGVRIYTDGDSDTGPRTDGGSGTWNTDKVAWYHTVSYPLSEVGVPSMSYSVTSGIQPGLQLVIDFDGNGTPDGILVGEAVYGNNWWLTNSAPQDVKDAAPHNGGGNGSQWYGTLNEWLAAFPSAKVAAVGFSLGSGVHADGILKSLTFGCHTWNFGLKTVQTGTPKVKNDTCGTKNDTYTIPNSEGVIYSVNGNPISAGTYGTGGKGMIVVNASPAEGYILKGKTSWKLIFNVVPCIPVTPKAPVFYDYCGASKPDSVEIPFAVGIVYKIDGKTVHPGTYPVTSASVVTAEALEGFVIREEATSTWTHEFTNSDCITISKTSEPVTDTNGDGSIGVGDTVTWIITVTNNSPNKYENFRVQVEDQTATTLENDGLIKNLEPGKPVTLKATSILSENDIKACKATNSASFTAWYSKKHQHIDRDGVEGDRFLPSHSEDSNTIDLSGSTGTKEATFTCPTPGSGNGGSTTTTTSSTSETPAELPATGPSDSNPMIIFAGSALAYIITYLIQRRRELSATN